jgi:hypothetical protein
MHVNARLRYFPERAPGLSRRPHYKHDREGKKPEEWKPDLFA